LITWPKTTARGGGCAPSCAELEAETTSILQSKWEAKKRSIATLLKTLQVEVLLFIVRFYPPLMEYSSAKSIANPPNQFLLCNCCASIINGEKKFLFRATALLPPPPLNTALLEFQTQILLVHLSIQLAHWSFRLSDILNGILHHENPNSPGRWKARCEELIREAHDGRFSGHFAEKQINELLHHRYCHASHSLL
jgi:hypothetical protein